MRRRITSGISALVAAVLIFAVGFFLGLSRQPAPQPTAAKPAVQATPEKPRRAYAQLYIDNHLGFQMEVPKEWVNRYAPLESGNSVGFAFETASSPSGTPKLDLAQVFTITRYDPAQFSEANCGCKELGHGKNVVFGYKFDGQNVPLAAPLTVAGIQAAMQTDIPPYFATTD